MCNRLVDFCDPEKYFKDDTVATRIEAHVARLLPVSRIEDEASDEKRVQKWASIIESQRTAFMAAHQGDPFDSELFVLDVPVVQSVTETLESWLSNRVLLSM